MSARAHAHMDIDETETPTTEQDAQRGTIVASSSQHGDDRASSTIEASLAPSCLRLGTEEPLPTPIGGVASGWCVM